jgi:DAACS family dicarboxylate/amino acid:cation (Na+ or H+) symporter
MFKYTLVVTTISVLLGVTMATVFQPGASLSPADRTALLERFRSGVQEVQMNAKFSGKPVGDIISSIVPKNPFEDMVHAFDPSYSGGGLLAVMFFALIFGYAMSKSDPEKVSTLKSFMEGLNEVVMKVIGYAMQLAPFGVASLLFMLTVNLGTAILLVLLKYVLVVIAALAIHQFVTYSIILRMSGMNPLFFFRNTSEVMLTAFSTSSSNATLPTAIKTTIEKLKMPKDISQFILTIGSTGNQNGTALYEGITILFLAQCFGVHLGIAQQILVVFISVLAGIGSAGVPGGSMPVIMLILISIGIPGESIALIYGVDRILDMSRTVLNVMGDITATVYISHKEAGKETGRL